MNRIFISRALKPDSPLLNIKGKKYTLLDRSLIEFSALDFSRPFADWIFFYSRNGVKYFFENDSYELYPYLWACMSHGTAEELSHYVTDISFVGTGSPEDVAKAYSKELDSNTITCYIRAKQSVDSVRQLINRKDDFSLPVYKNSLSQDVPDTPFDILLFTSPMNVDAWLNKRAYANEKVIAIGNTTAKQLEKHGIVDYIVAENPSEKSLAESLKTIL
ncbi:MAG: uroporphyrinogen-III synthase [Saprospiraceae bacterium]|nr:uroporphyrinogen-III synthase [Saprospiraceae bacterium]